MTAGRNHGCGILDCLRSAGAEGLSGGSGEYSPGCRFVIVTGDEQHKEEAYRAGAAGFVLKPYSEEEIWAELKKLY